MAMDLDKIVAEGERLLDILATLDPTETEVKIYDPQTGKLKKTEKPKYEHVQDLCIKWMEQYRTECTTAQDNNSKEYKNDIDNRKLDIEEMKLEIEKLKLQLEDKRAKRKDQLEADRLKQQKEQADRELDLKEKEVVERQTYTKGQAAWELGKLGLKVIGDIGITLVGICAIGKWETAGCLIGGTKAKFIRTKIG